jgi:hypothetical protein
MNIKEINWEKMVWRNRPRIEYLTSAFSGDKGERFTILLETDGEIYYNDCFGQTPPSSVTKTENQTLTFC